jgi:hypothetical protein
MGGTLKVGRSDIIDLTADVKDVAGGQVEFVVDGKPASKLDREISGGEEKVRVKWEMDGARHSIYARVRNREGKLVLIGNPIYIE